MHKMMKRLTVNSLAVLVVATGMTGLSIAQADEVHAFSGSNAVKPIANNVHTVTSKFGWRTHPISLTRKMHYGTDYRAKCGEPLVATDDGKISRNSNDPNGYGWWVEINHGDKKTRYAHMRYQSNLKVGQTVHRGQKIGEVGTTGGSTGCHLHFEALQPNGTRIDPAGYVKSAQRINTPLTVKSPIAQKWDLGAHGNPESNMGTGLKAGGSFQKFDGGSIHHSKSTGAHFTKKGSAIQNKWKGQGYENGSYGYPSTDERSLSGGAYQQFQGGSVHWSSKTGAYFTKRNGPIQKAWAAQKYENGVLGYPTSDERGLADGSYQKFQGGSIHYSKDTGAHFTKAGGAIQKKWGELGYEKGSLGYPSSSELDFRYDPDSTYQNFKGGIIVWSSDSGAHPLQKGMLNAWKAQGWERGELGYPTSGEYKNKSGKTVQDFENGRIVWDGGAKVQIH